MAPTPLKPVELADALEQFVREFGLVWSAAAAAPVRAPAPGGGAVGEPGPGAAYADAQPRRHPPSTRRCRSGRTPAICPSEADRQRLEAFREALLEERWDDCVDIARAQIRDGARQPVRASTTSAGMARRHAGARLAVRVPRRRCRWCSTRPSRRCCRPAWNPGPGRAVIIVPATRTATAPLAVRPDHAAGRRARRGRDGADHRRGRPEPREWKVRVAAGIIGDLVTNWGMRTSDIIIDCLPFPIATGQEEARERVETIEAIQVKRRHPEVQTTSACPTSRSASTRPPGVGRQLGVPERVHRGRAGLGHRARGEIVPMVRIPDEQREVGPRPGLRPAPAGDRGRAGRRFLDLFEGVTVTPRAERAAELASLRSRSGCSGGSSTARARASATTSTSGWPTSRPWRSSTPTCWPG